MYLPVYLSSTSKVKIQRNAQTMNMAMYMTVDSPDQVRYREEHNCVYDVHTHVHLRVKSTIFQRSTQVTNPTHGGVNSITVKKFIQRYTLLYEETHRCIHGDATCMVVVLKSSKELHSQSSHPCTCSCTYSIIGVIKRKLKRYLECQLLEKCYGTPARVLR